MIFFGHVFSPQTGPKPNDKGEKLHKNGKALKRNNKDAEKNGGKSADKTAEKHLRNSSKTAVLRRLLGQRRQDSRAVRVPVQNPGTVNHVVSCGDKETSDLG